ncbi:MAG: ergothioneine biosynthesis protein EgtB [Halieaceae bacterium]|nr:ergothioneine biosynthesis protein EgtB [Halieaceae bacterium]
MASNGISQSFLCTRQQSLDACERLEIEDYGLQAEAFTSPPKWHLAHTSWFFETFLLNPYLEGYQACHPLYEEIFNSYYNGVGNQYARAQRGLLSRPTVADVLTYRQQVDCAMVELLDDGSHPQRDIVLQRCRLGIQHEQQHQELFYTDLKYSLFANPLLPAFAELSAAGMAPSVPAAEQQWRQYEGGLFEAGLPADAADFSFDNESPAVRVYLEPFTLSNRLVTNREYQAFVDDGGYNNHQHWLADGWTLLQEERWQRPLYWLDRDDGRWEFTLFGLRRRDPDAPVCHLSGYEADAYASWLGARLPTEFEWEFAARMQAFTPLVFNAGCLHPEPASGDSPLLQLYDACWQWTGSAYRPYPGFSAGEGAIGEYNGKFMANQWVLKGGSCVSQSGHVRPTYRNFFYPNDRWQFSGLRLARDV